MSEISPDGLLGAHDLKVYLDIEEGFIGIPAGETSVVVRTPGTSGACGFSFKEGERYIVYASKGANGLATSLCSRTWPAKYAQQDIAYFRSLATRPATSWIYGSAKWYTYDPNFKPKYEVSIMDHYSPPEEDVVAVAPLADRKVTLRNASQTWETRVDAKGEFVFEDLRPGEYTVSVDFPPEMVPAGEPQVRVVAKGCAQVDFRTSINGRIQGTVQPAGPVQELSGFSVYVYRAGEGIRPYHYFRYAYVETDGNFDIGPLPPGEYFLAAKYSVKVPVQNGYTLRNSVLTWYPGVGSSREAKRIQVGRAEKVHGLSLMLSTQMEGQ